MLYSYVLTPDGPRILHFSIAEICEGVYQYTLANPAGEVFVDVDTFGNLGVGEVLRLLKELPAVARFANPQFAGVFRVANATWAVRTAITAVFNTVIYRTAPKTTLVFST